MALVLKISSGGHACVDRAALDFAIESGLEHGGCCPRGRKAEDNPVSAKYQLVETESAIYRMRTVRNVVDSDALQFFSSRQQGEGGSHVKKR